ncbi:nucleolar GTP-binding protein 2-like [Mugil cephalus]|uniref:nucleolar GTP-binding protein 2-like n=1 Tax=Mugil cephalus TaxID=48193 RepID=UPI001FB6E931|nr:nucleolar GTP-binding protein 2-like [Mugil cephalus]
MVLNDWQRGRIPFFVKRPGPEGDHEDDNTLAVGTTEVEENMQEEQPDNPDNTSEEQQQKQKEQVQKILANVRQNFGKINVAPEFCEEDLVPVEMPDLDMSDFSGSEGEEDGEEDEGEEEDGTSAEPANEESEVTEPQLLRLTGQIARRVHGQSYVSWTRRSLSISSSWTKPSPSASLQSGYQRHFLKKCSPTSRLNKQQQQ